MNLRTTGHLVAALAIALGPLTTPALANDDTDKPTFGEITVFATVPAPGHPFGVAVDKDRVYISTSAGDFFADPATGGHLNSDGERIFAYDKAGHLVGTTTITTMPNANMGLFGLALDPNVHIQEVKALAADILPGRRPRGPARLELVAEYRRRAGITAQTGMEVRG